jgi:hypothetical protein
MIFLSGPCIARLVACSRMTANERMRAGAYGPLLRRGQTFYAEQGAVERRHERQFTPAQIAAAIDGLPDRCIALGSEEEAA